MGAGEALGEEQSLFCKSAIFQSVFKLSLKKQSGMCILTVFHKIKNNFQY